MKTEEAIVVLQKIKPIPHRGDGKSITHTLEMIALDMAIKALEQQPCEDCISRQVVIDLVKGMSNANPDYWYTVDVVDREYLLDELEELPLVTPKFTDVEIQKMQEMEQAQLDRAYELGKAEIRPCEDCISRQESISAIQDEYYDHAVGIDIVDIIANLPSVQPKGWSGEWEYVQYDTPNIGNWHCSRCRELYYSTDKPRWNFCPNCGAKMEAEDE